MFNKKFKKIIVATLLGVTMIGSTCGQKVYASTTGTGTYANNTAELNVDCYSTGTRAYASIYYPVKTDLKLKLQLYINVDGTVVPANSEPTSGTSTMIGMTLPLSTAYVNEGYKVYKARGYGSVSNWTFVNSKTGKNYVQDVR